MIIDYGMGNLASVRRAFEECGAEAVLLDDPDRLAEADRFILPGVGAFGDGMANLRDRGWVPKINAALENPQVAMLGICLGMQLLATTGYEGGVTAGLDLVPGEVKRFEPVSSETRIPHVGWNEVRPSGEAALFAGIPEGTDFYFVHSFCLLPAQPESVIARTPYCGEFTSAVGVKNVFGVQFHPEKSSRPGFRLLKNFLAFRPN
jgi:glutamine amidotransferase